MGTASCRGEGTLEGVWHQAVRTNYAWRFYLFYSLGWLAGAIGGEWFRMWYYSTTGIIWTGNHLLSLLTNVFVLIFLLPFILWIDRNKVPAMLKFDDAGVAMQLKTGLVIDAGWNLVRSVKFGRREKLTIVRLRGQPVPFTGYFPIEVKDALMAKAAGMRQGPPAPTAPTLEDLVDSRIGTNARI